MKNRKYQLSHITDLVKIEEKDVSALCAALPDLIKYLKRTEKASQASSVKLEAIMPVIHWENDGSEEMEVEVSIITPAMILASQEAVLNDEIDEITHANQKLKEALIKARIMSADSPDIKLGNVSLIDRVMHLRQVNYNLRKLNTDAGSIITEEDL